jgi:Uma2 family endonuclease
MVRPARDPRDELYEAYLRVPEHQHAEIANGTLYVMSRPAPRHADAASMLGIELGNPFRRGRGGPGGWWLLDEPELQLVPKEPIIPDLAGSRVERMPQLPDTAHFTLVPDWVCEVLSRSTETFDRDEKLPYYAQHGDPRRRALPERHAGAQRASCRAWRCPSYEGRARDRCASSTSAG